MSIVSSIQGTYSKKYESPLAILRIEVPEIDYIEDMPYEHIIDKIAKYLMSHYVILEAKWLE